jgi:hypothetical protein
MRGVEIDVANGERSAFTYTKLGRFAVLGVVVPMRNPWSGTRVRVHSGFVKPSKVILPRELAQYFIDRARLAKQLMDAIPRAFSDH